MSFHSAPHFMAFTTHERQQFVANYVSSNTHFIFADQDSELHVKLHTLYLINLVLIIFSTQP